MFPCLAIATIITLLCVQNGSAFEPESRQPARAVKGVGGIALERNPRHAEVKPEGADQDVNGNPDASITASPVEAEGSALAPKQRRFLNRRFVQTCRTGPLSAVKEFLKQGADINARDRDGQTALMAAALSGRADLVRELLAHGADVDARSGFGSTPLMAASYFGFLEVAQVLLARGADANAHNDLGQTPLSLAVKKGGKEMRALLLKSGAR
ncbi:MAG: ankyrin repeat domain-containing protein [Deltaproteobacteria bacterium]|nr:ankyrin repeat domain-containing protein [Deltaproteobacteria bacterium]